MKLYFERIFYYWRQSMFGHVHALCSQFSKENGDPLWQIWDGLASGAEGKTSAGLSQLQRLSGSVSLALPIAVAKLCVHKMAKMQDFASIGQCESDIESLQRSANAMAVIQAAQIFWLGGDTNSALNLVQPLTTQSAANRSAAALIGWIKLTCGDRSAGRWFDMASGEKQEPLVTYGKAMYYANVARWQDALQMFVQLSGDDDFPEGTLERAHVYAAMNNWDLAIETVNEAEGKCVSDCEVHLMNAIHMLSHTGDLDGARGVIASLCTALEKAEGSNPLFLMQVVSVLIGLSWRDKEIVSKLLPLFTPAAKLMEDNPDVQVMYGKLLLYSGRSVDAKDTFQNALTQTTDNVKAFAGLVESHIAMNQLGEARNQLEFLEAIVDQLNVPLTVVMVRAKFSRVQRIPLEADSLIEAMKRHLDAVQQVFTPQSARPNESNSMQKLLTDKYLENFMLIDMDCFTAALTEALHECNTLDWTVANPRNGPVCDLIARALEFVPGSVPFSYYLAVLAFGEERYAQATRAIQSVLTSHWGFNASQCHLLLAQIRLQMKQFDDAEAALSRAVSYDFGIRSSMRYQMINAQLCEARAQYTKAIEILRDIMKGAEYEQSSPNEKVNLSLFYAECYQKMDQMSDALKIVADAQAQWAGTPDADRISIFKASLLASGGRIREGLDILEAYEPKNPNYTKAQKMAAKIYLTKLNDKAAYVRCFKQMVSQSRNKTNYLLLGEAYMKVNMFKESVECFNAALESDPSDQNVALHLARALMVVHDYEQALDVYLRAIELGHNDSKSQLEYCKALIKLRRLDDARDAALAALEGIDAYAQDWDSQSASADFYEILSEIYAKSGDTERSGQELDEALSIYSKLTAPGRVDIPADNAIELKRRAAALYQKESEMFLAKDDRKSAVESLNNALELNPGDPKVLLALAKLHLEDGNNDKCREVCQQLLKADDKCEDAALMLAEVSSSESVDDLEEAFQKSPTFYRTLVRLIEKCARAGELDRVPSLFEKCPDPNAPGLSFCKGLYSVYMGKPQDALKALTNCRSDHEWGPQAMQLIFVIYSNPNRKYVWCETKPLATAKDLEAAKKVLLRFDPSVCDVDQFQALFLLSQNTTDSVTEALKIYEEADADDLNATIGKCKCFLRLDKQRDATRNLNGIIHGEATHSNFSIFVEAFLMMTYISLKDGQIDEADRYVERALDLNKSCGKAWEMKGIIAEKKKEFLFAADAYKMAWNLSGHADLGIGFKLAVNYMRGEDPVEAIKVCRAILSQHPNYPKLKETVFLPCCAQLRP